MVWLDVICETAWKHTLRQECLSWMKYAEDLNIGNYYKYLVILSITLSTLIDW